jgi:hypothetical protein
LPAAGESARQALERGDFATARRLARAARSHPDPEEQKVAREILARLSPDPLVSLVVLVSCALMAWLAWHYLG